jgi:protein-tyrosine-phosphatase
VNPEDASQIGIDLDGAHPKPLTTDAVHASDVVTTMGCGACPIFPANATSTELGSTDEIACERES